MYKQWTNGIIFSIYIMTKQGHHHCLLSGAQKAQGLQILLVQVSALSAALFTYCLHNLFHKFHFPNSQFGF